MSSNDVAAIAGIVFAQPEKYIGKAFDIAGDELTFPDAALALGVALGEPVRYTQVPWDTIRAQGEDFYLMYDWFERRGYDVDIENVRKMQPELLDFRAWARRGSAKPLAERRTA